MDLTMDALVLSPIPNTSLQNLNRSIVFHTTVYNFRET